MSTTDRAGGLGRIFLVIRQPARSNELTIEERYKPLEATMDRLGLTLVFLAAWLMSQSGFASGAHPRPRYKDGELLIRQDNSVPLRSLLDTLASRIGAT